jgi:transcriptional regulator with XRE-family HTH domain
VPRPTLLFAVPRLRRYRIEQRLTQAELARKAGLTRTSIVRLEAPTGSARIETIRKLARALGVTEDELMRQPD